MSCFETSIFLSNPDEHLLISVAKAACDALNWQYNQNKNRFYITDVGRGTDLNGEYALAIIGNKLMKNTFYLRDNKATYYVEQLLQKYNELLPDYEKQVIVNAFKQQGYGYVDQSEELAENPKLVFSFAMQAMSKLQNETDKTAKIHFTVSNQGNIVTESNYIPADIHVQADHAMANIELKLGMKRRIYPKEIPPKYAKKTFCQPKNNVLTQ
ncbi:MAG: hypothetical protein KA783_04350 [Chitinophagales bacterium]|nr:hypothetical protein [Chitinophagales bacterium]MBP7533653.1 hypothetical protein [Chitinophagales bacterium]